MTDYYAIKVMHPAESIEVSDRIEWCKENDVFFFTQSIMGYHVAGEYYTEEEMKSTGIIKIPMGEIDLSAMVPMNIGTVFAFKTEEDVTGFKLTWT